MPWKKLKKIGKIAGTILLGGGVGAGLPEIGDVIGGIPAEATEDQRIVYAFVVALIALINMLTRAPKDEPGDTQ